ncbi:MAG: nucleotidyl transferase AbiEii/AbiGii toxin family protein [Candidatus Hydrogenedentes bacterium]|nr:nucleotidyl transferase AbiEii/AbiGii toxin family protein [Candidatus Hydrogenedentota bacterium]
MSVQAIQQRLNAREYRSEDEEDQALREITQEVILAALGRGDFFTNALFQGGTCLRIFHGLNRFSEDLDFILRDPDPTFRWGDHLARVEQELRAYGYRFEIVDRTKADAAVKKAFLKDDSLGKVLELQFAFRKGPLAKIRIKLEIDTNPPAASGVALEYMDFPFLSAVSIQDMPTLFAGKLHALLCREYIKGRDWFDFLWYTGRGTPVNYAFLSAALEQVGPWTSKGETVNIDWLAKELGGAIDQLDLGQAAKDVERFLPASELPSLNLWSRDLFLRQLDKWRAAQPD